MRNYFLYFLLLLSIGAFVTMSLTYKSQAHRFFGIANSDAVEINYPYSYKVEKLFVTTGESIRKGDLLATLIRNDLTLDKELVNNQVRTHRAEENLKKNQIEASVKVLAVQYKIDIDNINFEIKELERKNRINEELLFSINGEKSLGVNPILLKLKQLKRDKKNLSSLFYTQKKSLKKELKDQSNLFKKKVNTLHTELAGMSGDEKALEVLAPFDGIVSKLNHQLNEDVQAFETLMLLNSAKPTYVKAYISIENKSQVVLGQEVEIIPITGLDRNTTLLGKIKSFSANVVAYPNRLKRYQNVELWGIEVIIEIPNNKFILGEKIIVLNGERKSLIPDNLITYFFQTKK